MCAWEGRHTHFVPTLCTLSRAGVAGFLTPHTMNQPSSGPWEEFTWLHVSLRVATWRTAPFPCLSFLIKISGYLHLKNNHTPKRKAQIKIPNTVTNLRLSLWSPRVTAPSWFRVLSENQGMQHRTTLPNQINLSCKLLWFSTKGF